MRIFLGVGAALILCLGWVSAARAENPKYVLKDLGTLDAMGNTQAMGINSKGDVVGYGDVGANEHAFRYSNGTLTDLGTMGGMNSRAFGISDAGLIGGEADTFSSTSKIAMLYAGGQMSAVVTFGGSLGGINGVSPNGTIAGSARTAGDGPFRGFLRFSNGAVSQIPFVNGTDTANFAFAVSDTSYSVGITQTAGGRLLAFFYGPFVNATSLDSRASGDSAAFAISSSLSSVVGSTTTGAVEHAASLGVNAVPTDLGTLPGGTFSRALGVNASNTVVGYSNANGTFDQRGFIIPDLAASTPMLDLNDLIVGGTTFTIMSATAINDAGQITAYGPNTTGGWHALLLTPYVAPSPPPPPPPAAPKISAAKNQSTKKATFLVKGRATGLVTKVTYKIGKKSGTAKGKNKWQFTAKLKPGGNIATVTAQGPGGKSAPFKITITRK